MPIDAYDPCPCGSGKKLKFCCAAAAEEIEKVKKHQENRQTQASLQVLDRVISTKPDLPWGYVTKSRTLLSERQYREAAETLVPLLEKNPDHPFGTALYATTAFAAIGFDKAKPAIYRAFQRCSLAFPDVVGSLSLGIAAWMFSRQKYMASRQYLAQAMRLMPDEEKQDIFVRLLEFDGNGNLPYPLRSVHSLISYAGPESAAPERKEEIRKLVHRAQSLVALGCFEPAADTYRNLAEQDPEAGRLWQNVGFCAAWDGNTEAAAEALHRAATLHQDAEAAVECETLAQLLEHDQPEARLRVKRTFYRVHSVSRLLTLLDEHDQFYRVPKRPHLSEEEKPKIALFTVMDRKPLPEEPDLWPELNDIPQAISEVGIDLQARQDEPQVMLSGVGELFDSARELYEACAGEVIESSEDDQYNITYSEPNEQRPMLFNWHFPRKMPFVRQRQLEQRRWEQNIQEIWPNTPLAGLKGKTPNEARGDASLEIPLRAAIYVLDAFCDREVYVLDVPALCEQFGVPAPTPIEPHAELPLQTFSAMQLHRLNVPELSDDQLLYVHNRMLLIHHRRFLHDVLLEVLSRPSCAEQTDLDRAYSTLAELAGDRNDRDETYRWISEGQKHAQNLEDAFEKTFHWEMRELAFRAEDPGDPNLMPLVHKLARKYAKKVPQMLTYLGTMLTTYGIDPPANLAEMAEDPGSLSSGGIWTPGQDSTEPGEKKLWLPGQS